MAMMDTIRARHSVREYDGRAPEGEALATLQAIVDECARKSGLNIQLVTGNPEAFQVVARFGLVHGADANIAFVTSNGKEDDETIGFWGQKIVLAAQEAGLNTCWVAINSRRKNKAARAKGEKVRIIIAVGYGKTQGVSRKTKPIEMLSTVECAETPAWFATAMEAAQLAPTAMNNQNFHVTLHEDGRTVSIEAPKGGWNTVDLGIVKRNFQEAADELGADWCWEKTGSSQTHMAKEAPMKLLDKPPCDPHFMGDEPVVVMELENGEEVRIALYPDLAPITVAYFLTLVNRGFYDGLTFHRLVPGFIIQGGDPTGTGDGETEHYLKGEFAENGVDNPLLHTQGALSMARQEGCDTASCQFFIMLRNDPGLDGHYAAFGHVIDGMEAIEELEKTPVDADGTPLTPIVMKRLYVEE